MARETASHFCSNLEIDFRYLSRVFAALARLSASATRVRMHGQSISCSTPSFAPSWGLDTTLSWPRRWYEPPAPSWRDRLVPSWGSNGGLLLHWFLAETFTFSHSLAHSAFPLFSYSRQGVIFILLQTPLFSISIVCKAISIEHCRVANETRTFVREEFESRLSLDRKDDSFITSSYSALSSKNVDFRNGFS